MENNKTRLLIGGALLVIGLISLLKNLDIFYLSEEYVLSLIFAGVGAMLMQHGWAAKGSRPWTFYLGGALVVVGAIIFIAENRFFPDQAVATLVLWLCAGLLFRVYQHDRNKNWWVLLFAGPMFTIGLVVLLEGLRLLRGDIIGVLIMFGFAATFGYLYTLRSPERKLDWAKFPAAVFFLIGVFIFLAREFHGTIPFFISGVFILTGLYMIYRTVRADFGSSKPQPPSMPTELPQAG
jgi:hypothetical protein